MVEYYSQRASAGLIITEGTWVSEEAQGWYGVPGIYNEEQGQAWQKVTDAVHERGGRIFAQLWHQGGVSHHSFYPDGQPASGPLRDQPGAASSYPRRLGHERDSARNVKRRHQENCFRLTDTLRSLRARQDSTESSCRPDTSTSSTSSCMRQPIAAQMNTAEPSKIARAFCLKC